MGINETGVSDRKDLSPPLAESQPGAAGAEARQLALDALRSELVAQYREELFAYRREAASRSEDQNKEASQPKGKRWLDDNADAELRTFIKGFSEKKEQRKYQLSLIKEYLADPSRFGPQSDVIPTSTTVEEFEERKRDLAFRIALLKTLLALSEEEQRLLLQAESFAQSQAAGDPPS